MNLFQEKENWKEREKEYLQKMDEMTETHMEMIELEKVKDLLLFS